MYYEDTVERGVCVWGGGGGCHHNRLLDNFVSNQNDAAVHHIKGCIVIKHFATESEIITENIINYVDILPVRCFFFFLSFAICIVKGHMKSLIRRF